MRLVLLNDKNINEELAMSIYASNGMVYAKEGMKLNDRNIKTLTNAGINTVYIKDQYEEINLKEVLSTPIRIDIVRDLTDIFAQIKKNNFIDETKIMNIADKIIKNIDISENSFMLNNISNKDNESKLVTHSINTALLSLIIASKKSYDKSKLEKLIIGALLHDIGKLFDESKNHPKLGYDLIKKNSHLPVTSYMAVLQHHEYENRTGYPDKLSSDKIHEFGKIISLCNDYDNLQSSNKFNSPNDIIEYITSQSEHKYNKDIFESFINSIYCYPNGLYVKLNNGENGVVIMQNKHFPSRPMIGVVKNGTPITYNLMEDLTLFIEEIVM